MATIEPFVRTTSTNRSLTTILFYSWQKLIKCIRSTEAPGEASCKERSNSMTPEASLKNDISLDVHDELGNDPGEVAFFQFLHSEYRKVTHFVESTQREFAIRETRVLQGLEILKRPNFILVNDKWQLFARSVHRLYRELLCFETFCIMSYVSFSKILKKHDKVTGLCTRCPFMENVVSRANFANYPELKDMIRRCEDLYQEVSDRLVEESLHEDQRLFLNMVNKFKEQSPSRREAPVALRLKDSYRRCGAAKDDRVLPRAKRPKLR